MDDKGEMNFSKILFLHINRILTFAGVDTDMYIAAVEAFDDVLSPYHNGLDVKEAKDKYDKVIGTDDAYKGKKPMLKDAERNLARAKFKALMKVAETKNLLLTKTDRDEVWELGEILDGDEAKTKTD